MAKRPARDEDLPTLSDELSEAFDRTVHEGEFRLGRTLPGLVATGLIGGADVSLGVFALLLVKKLTGSEVAGAAAFSIGFIALTLAKGELFTEDFLVPVATVAARRASPARLARLWGGTLSTNLVAGWLVMGLIVSGFPQLGAPAAKLGAHYSAIGLGWRSFAGGLLGGAVITLMTWMQHSTEGVGGRVIAAFIAAFMLAAAPLNHVIVVSLEMFGGLQHGAPYGYVDWLTVAAWYTLANIIGGVVLVTGLRLVQTAPRLGEERGGS